MSEKMKDGKWYVPRDLGIIKATEMGRFDYADRNVLLSMRVIENHVNGIEFGVDGEDNVGLIKK